MARKRKSVKGGGGGTGPAAVGALWFLLALAIVVGGIIYYNPKNPLTQGGGQANNQHSQGPVRPPVTPPVTPPVRPPVTPPVTPPVGPTVVTPNPPPRHENPVTDVEDTHLSPITPQVRLEEVGPIARQRLKPYFTRAKVAYPPTNVVLVVLKREKSLEIWAGDDPENFKPITAYQIPALSGTAGPKLRQGDGQVPEGIYKVTAINPTSKNYLSMMLDYPNDYDRTRARQDGRTTLGGDITIHGGAASTSTVPVGPRYMEELYTLVGDAGLGRVRVVIAPYDLRKVQQIGTEGGLPAWSGDLYKQLRDYMVGVAMRGG